MKVQLHNSAGLLDQIDAPKAEALSQIEEWLENITTGDKLVFVEVEEDED